MARGRNYNVRRDPFTGRFATAENAKVVQAEFLDYARRAKKNILAEYSQLAPLFMKEIEGFNIPVYTGNMHDGVGVGILVNNSIRKWHGGGWFRLRKNKDNEKDFPGTRIGTPLKRKMPSRLVGFKYEYKTTRSGKRKTIKHVQRAAWFQHWGTFGGLISKGKGWSGQFLLDINKYIRRDHANKTDVTIMLFTAMPYSQPINDGYARDGMNAGWFEPVIESFAGRLEQGIKRAFLMTKPTVTGKVPGIYKGDIYSPFKYEFNLQITQRLKWYGLIR